MKCAVCDNHECYTGKDCAGIAEDSAKEYTGGNLKSMKVSAALEADYYMVATRLEELILYAKEMGCARLGMAFCVGLSREAKVIHDILKKDFKVHSVCCKVGGIDKSDFKLKRMRRDEGAEATCNPIGQAMVLNREKTELNVIVGLCMGHDALFTKYSEAPVTTLIVKDRVLAHNPIGAVYSNYYLKKRFGV